jgi:hypothetical protein
MAVDHGAAGQRRSGVFSETESKRRKGFSFETKVKRGVRIVRRDKEPAVKLGRSDLYPCRSGKRVKKGCPKSGCF